MVTDKIRIDSAGNGIREIMDEAEKYAGYTGLEKKDAMQLRLMCEETTEMLRHLAGEFTGCAWLEFDENRETNIHLEVKTDMDKEKREKLINVSSDKKNTFSRGIMGKIREVVELFMMDEDAKDKLTDYDFLQMGHEIETSGAVVGQATDYELWSLSQYKSTVDVGRNESDKYGEAWDELEKSIIANIADDIRIGIRDRQVVVIVSKKFQR